MVDKTPSTRVIFCRSNPIAPDPRVEKEARCLAESGYSVRVLGWDRSSSLPRKEETKGINVERISIRSGYARGLSNLPALLLWQLGLLLKLIKLRKKYDLIHACDFDTILPALICKKLFNKIVIYDIFDFYADHLRKTPGWIKKLIRSTDLRAINHADAVILVDDSRFTQIQGACPKQAVIINNSPEDKTIDLESPVVGDNYSLRLAYIGLIQVERGLLHVLGILKRHPTWILDIGGFGGDEVYIKEISGDMSNVRWHGRISYQKALNLSAGADVLFALYDPDIPNHRYASPNKIFEAMMLGKPIVVARGTNMDCVVDQAKSGLVVDYGDAFALEEVFTKLEQDHHLRLDLGKNAREAYKKKYSWEIMKVRLLLLYQSLLEDSVVGKPN